MAKKIRKPSRVRHRPFSGIDRALPPYDPNAAEPTDADAPLDQLLNAGPSDVQFATYLLPRVVDRLRYDHRRGAWFEFEGHGWQQDMTGRAKRVCVAIIGEMRAYAERRLRGTKRSKEIQSFLYRAESLRGLNTLLDVLKDLLPIAMTGKEWDPDHLVIGAPNGVVDLRTGERRDGRPNDFIRTFVAVPYDLLAECPRWVRFVLEVFGPDLASYIQRVTGYFLTGLMTEQAFWMLCGEGSNGKSTFLETLAYVFGDYAWVAPSSTFDHGSRNSIPNDLASLEGKRFVIGMSEASPHGGTRLNEARIKQITGGDTVTARRLYQEFTQLRLTAKLMLAFNHMPRIDDDSHGMWRRIRLIELTRTFDPDPTLHDQLKAEAPGILAWAVMGSIEYLADGLQTPDCVMGATDQYRKESDPLEEFIVECCEARPGGHVAAGKFYEAYRGWCERNSVSLREQLSRKEFGARAKLRLEHGRTSKGVRYLNIALVPPAPQVSRVPIG